MVKFDKTWFGGVSVDGKEHYDVLVINNKLIDRHDVKPGWFDKRTHHTVYEHELEKLLEENPEIILIGNGQDGVLKVPEEVENAIKGKGIELIVMKTPDAIEEYNKLAGSKKVNALIHTTC